MSPATNAPADAANISTGSDPGAGSAPPTNRCCTATDAPLTTPDTATSPEVDRTSIRTPTGTPAGRLTVALAGNPNAGKTALFNALTGLRQKTGNWPGVTVECREGQLSGALRHGSLVDTPGTYSLDATTLDQLATRAIITGGGVDVLLVVLDATSLERHLYLGVQLAELGVPMVIALNMMDAARRAGIVVDTDALGDAFGCEVVPIVAITGEGIGELTTAIGRAADTRRRPHLTVDYGEVLEAAIDAIDALLDRHATSPDALPRRTVALRLLTGDPSATPVAPADASALDRIVADVESALADDAELVVAHRRAARARELAAMAVTRPAAAPTTTTTTAPTTPTIAIDTGTATGGATSAISATATSTDATALARGSTTGSAASIAPMITGSDRIDRVVLHRVWGVPIFLAVMYTMFAVTIDVGGAFVDLFDGIVEAVAVDGLGAALGALGTPKWLIVLLADGVGGGLQVVASFVPIVGALYLALSVLEDSGYLARAALVMDRTMRRIGLPGRAFVPMIVGFGCNVPAVMATRTLDGERERRLTMLMNPFMSCGARLPVYALFAAAFFPVGGQNVVFALYLVGIGVAIGTGWVMTHSLLPGRSEGLLMELPPYRRPTWRSSLLHAWDRLRVFVRGAGKVIVTMVTVLAILGSVGTDGSFGNEDSPDSLLSAAGRTVAPAFAPIGVDDDNWPAAVGIFTGVLAKEAVVGTLDSLYGSLADDELSTGTGTDTGINDGADDEFDLIAAVTDAIRTVPANLTGLAATITDPIGLHLGIDAADEANAVDPSTRAAMTTRFDGRVGAFAYLLFILLYFPCVAVIGAIAREAGRAWAGFVAAWATALAFAVATVFYQAATFAEHPLSSSGWLLGVGLAAAIAFAGLRSLSGRTRPFPPPRPAPVATPPAAVPVTVTPRRRCH